MTREEIVSGLAEILEEVCGVHPDDVTDDATFVEDLDVDSLSMVEVVVVAEEKFGVKIPDEDVEGIRTIGEAVDYIGGRIEIAELRRRLAELEDKHRPKRGFVGPR